MTKSVDPIKRLYGVYRGQVADNRDPDNLRRLSVRVTTTGSEATTWAWPVEPSSIHTAVPAIGEGVWVSYIGGDPDYPIWLGTFGKNQSPNKQMYIKPLANSVSLTSIQDVIIVNSQKDGTKELDLTDSLIAIANKENTLQATLQQVQNDLGSIIAGQGVQGAQGRQGTTGAQGVQGTQGTTGAGTQGSTGTQGTTGSQGVTGSQGTTGAGTQGATGTSGSTGAQGTQGSTGVQGAEGSGTQGATGSQGATGTQGANGSNGTQGTAGADGSQGTTGAQGSTGSQGANGSDGAQGATGTQGSTGTQGTTGSQGVQGTTGTGTQGATGTQGSTGAGTQGTQGVQGTTGTTGAGGTVAYYGNFYDDADQSAPVNTPTAIKFNHDFGSNGVSVQSDGTNLTQITFAHTGTYNIQFSAEYHNTGGGGNGQTVQVWFKKNGTNVPQSNTYVTVNTNSPYIVAAWNFVDTVTAGDYYQLMWETDNANIILGSFASATNPAVPSVILTATQVAYSIQGIQGLQGGTGTQGSTGSTGSQGTTGTQGISGATASAPLTLTQSSNNANFPLTISSANEQSGGTGYSDILKLINSKSGATNTTKYIRLNSTGGLEIVNSAYSSTIFAISDGGAVTAALTYNGASLGESGWIAVSSFSNNFTAPTAVAYRKINGVVYLRGNLTGGTANTVAFTLPSGYRPSVSVVIPVQQYGTANISYVTVSTNGDVTPNATAGWLSSIIFPTG